MTPRCTHCGCQHWWPSDDNEWLCAFCGRPQIAVANQAAALVRASQISGRRGPPRKAS